MLLLLAMTAVCAAWACAALAMPGHRRALIGSQAPPAVALRILAVTFAAAALALCVWRNGPALGVLLWVCLVCVGAWLVVLGLAFFSAGAPRKS